MSRLPSGFPIRDPDRADERQVTDYDPNRGGWYPPETPAPEPSDPPK
ncbi:hypothetical protein [Streptomyces kronopolitis]